MFQLYYIITWEENKPNQRTVQKISDIERPTVMK